MIQGKTVLGIIPARGGSKGVPRKNLRRVGGRPLIQWTIDAARRSGLIDRLILSSEDPEIIRTAERLGCEVPFVRPEGLSRDDTPGIDPLLHALDNLDVEFDYVVMLQPTSPLRITEDIDAAIKKCFNNGAPFCVSVVAADKHPAWCYQMDEGETLVGLCSQRLPARRQDLPDVYSLNGALYVGLTEQVRRQRGFFDERTVAYIMPRERSVDIDSEFDIQICEFLLRQRNKPVRQARAAAAP